MSSIFTRKSVKPSVYIKYLDNKYGREWVNFEPEALWLDLKDEQGIVPTDAVKNKINAIKVCLTTNRFFDDVVGFEKIVIALNDGYVDPSTLQVCSPEEICYAIAMAMDLYDDEHIVKKFKDTDVKTYIQGACDAIGLVVYPSLIKDLEPKPINSLVEKIRHDINTFKTDTEKYTEKPSNWQNTLLTGIKEYVTKKIKEGEYVSNIK